MEEVLAAHPDVAECAVIGVADELKGQVPLGFVVLKAGVDAAAGGRSPAELVALVRERIGPVAAFKTAPVVKRLPKTRSGKILRGTMRHIADGEPCTRARHDRRPGDPRRDRAVRSPGSGTREACRVRLQPDLTRRGPGADMCEGFGILDVWQQAFAGPGAAPPEHDDPVDQLAKLAELHKKACCPTTSSPSPSRSCSARTGTPRPRS